MNIYSAGTQGYDIKNVSDYRDVADHICERVFGISYSELVKDGEIESAQAAKDRLSNSYEGGVRPVRFAASLRNEFGLRSVSELDTPKDAYDYNIRQACSVSFANSSENTEEWGLGDDGALHKTMYDSLLRITIAQGQSGHWGWLVSEAPQDDPNSEFAYSAWTLDLSDALRVEPRLVNELTGPGMGS